MREELQVKSDTSKLVQKYKKLLQKQSTEDVATQHCTHEHVCLFKEILQTFLDAPVRFVLKNFNKPECLCAVEVLAIDLCTTGKACAHHVNVLALFPEIEDWVSIQTECNSIIPIKIFLEEAHEIANILQREISIIHCFGAVNDSTPATKEYGPFLPQ